MIRIHDLPDDAGKYAVDNGDFPSEITNSGERVAVVMTQNWCPDWLMMRSWLRHEERNASSETPDIDVYLFVYNQVDYFDAFRRHKEQTFGNALIPYVRYYQGGQSIGESNQLSRDAFVKRFAP